MTNTEKIESIRQACIKANPSILDLVFGCEFKTQQFSFEGTTEVVCGFFHGEKPYCLMCWRREHKMDVSKITEIIGRPIRLADVLLAVGKFVPECMYCDISEERTLIKMPDGTMKSEKKTLIDSRLATLLIQWQSIRDDLRSQSEETINFLYELLK